MAGEFFADVGSTTYDLDVALKLDIEDFVTFLSPLDAPFINGLGGVPILPQGSVFQKKYEWLEDEALTPRTTLDGAYTADGGTLTVQSGDAANFQEDDALEVNDTIYRVTAVDTADHELDVTVWDDGDGGTDDASHSDGDDVVAVGTLPREGADPHDFRARDRDRLHNYTQIFGPEPIEMSESEVVVGTGGKYGVSNEWDYQLATRTRELVQKMEQAILYSRRKDDTSAQRRSLGGLNYFIQTNDDDTSAAFGLTKLRDLQQDCYNAGGQPSLLVVSPKTKTAVSDIQGDIVRLERDDNVRGAVVDYIDSDFGRVYIVLHRWVKDADAFLFNPEQTEWANFRPLQFSMLAKTGDRRRGMVVAEKGFKFRAEKWAGKMSAIDHS